MRVGLGFGRRLVGLGERVAQLAELVVQVGERAGHVGIVELDRGRAPLQLSRVQERRQRLRDVVKDLRAAGFVSRLRSLPALFHLAGRAQLSRRIKDVRMAPNELLVDRAGDAREISPPLVLQQQREEERLEEEVAELVLELARIAGDRGVRHLVGLFDRVRDDRLRRLLAIPGAVAA